MRLTPERPPSVQADPAAQKPALFIRLLPLLLVLLAFALRMVHLAYESLDLDEADGAAFVAVGLDGLVGRLFQQGQNGPLYYLILGLWVKVAGTGEFALRFPSAMFGTVLIALCYVTGRHLTDRRTSLFTAAIAACSTYLIYYAQMVKMYALLTMLAMLSSYLLLRALEQPNRLRWAAYVAAVSVTMYTHIFGVLLLPWHIGYVLLLRNTHRPAFRSWMAATVLLTLPYVPLGWWHWDALKTIGFLDRQFTGPRSLTGMLATLAREYGTRYDLLPEFALAAFFLAAAVLGLVALAYGRPEERRPEAALFLGVGIMVPLTLIYLLTLLGAPVFSSRYLAVTLPPFLLLWGAGMAAVARRRTLLVIPAFGLFLALNGIYLVITDIDGRRFRENWRDAVGYVDQVAQDGDAILMLNPSAGNAYRYYAERPLPILAAASLLRLEERERTAALAEAVKPFRRLWVVFAYFEVSDYDKVRPWFERETHIQEQRWLGGVRVAEHVTLPVPSFTAPAPQTTVNLSFEGRLQITGFDSSPVPGLAGQPWQVRLYWKALARLDTDYAVSLRLLDAAGAIWSQADGPAGNEFHQTADWQPGRVVPDERKLWLLPGTPPGTYRLALLVYRQDPLRNLRLDGAAPEQEFGLLTTLRLDRPVPAALEALPGGRDDAFQNGARLVGVELPATAMPAGHDVPLVLFWLRPGSNASLGIVEMKLDDTSGRTATHRTPLDDLPAQPAPYVVAQQMIFPVPGRLRAGPHALTLRLLDRAGEAIPLRRAWWQAAQSAVSLGDVVVLPDGRQRSFAAPGDLTAMTADFSNGMRLLGFRQAGPRDGAARAEDTLAVTLVWEAAGEPQASYTATVQLLSESGSLLAQHDDRPAGGSAPTESWQQGEFIEDVHELQIPAGTRAGRYRMIVAAYDTRTGARLQTEKGLDHVVLGIVEVVR